MADTPSDIFEQAVRFELGQGVDRDYAKAFELYSLSASMGNVSAECAVADMYMSGRGVDRDPSKGLETFLSAAGKGSGKAMLNIGMIYLVGAGVEPDKSKALEWLLRSAEAGEKGAYAELGAIYINGDGVEQDLEEGGRWLLRSAESGDPISQFKVGYMYEEGEGLPKDVRQAFMWYEKAAEQELPDALFKVASMLCDGTVEKDEIKALEYYTRSARLGFVPAMFNLGVMRFTRCEYEEAYKWFQNGAFRSDPDCQFYFGRMYIEGKGVNRDIAQGVKWLKLSARNGNKMAQDVIDRVESDSGKD